MTVDPPENPSPKSPLQSPGTPSQNVPAHNPPGLWNLPKGIHFSVSPRIQSNFCSHSFVSFGILSDQFRKPRMPVSESKKTESLLKLVSESGVSF